MKHETFTNEKTGTQYVRVSKQVALKAFTGNSTLIISPVNANPNFWEGILLHYVTYIPDEIPCDPVNQFDYVCNSIIYYNCDNELGRYLKYYLPVNVARKYGYKGLNYEIDILDVNTLHRYPYKKQVDKK